MKINKYHALCSNEILKLIVRNDSKLSLLSDNYNSLFSEFNTVDFIWPLISTSLLMSENLYKYDKSYKLISDSTLKLIADKLYLYPVIQLDEKNVGPCLLDDKNNIASGFMTYIKTEFEQYDFDNSKYGKYFIEEDLQLGLMADDFREMLENLRKEGSYGCNDSIIEDGFINIRKFIERTRNALAHSNYEVIDENHIRLYHYNTNTKKLDFNVILEPSIIVLIADELNEIASDKYSYFMVYYNEPSNSLLLEDEITDEKIIEYMLSFDMFDRDVALNILNEIKNKEEYLNAKLDDDKVVVINKAIYEKIKPVYDVGIILNEYLYCDKNGRIVDDELYDKYGVFNYLNSEYYNTVEVNINDNIYVQNKFKFLLLALLNCSLLNGYNINEGKDIGIIDFSKMNVDEEIVMKFLEKNSVKTSYIIEELGKEIEKNKKLMDEKSILIAKRQDILKKHNMDNDYFNIVLPSEINKLKTEQMKINESNISIFLEIEKVKKQGSMYNFDKNISQFIFNHLRNSLAHGYVKFPDNINLANISDVIINFEDYNPDDKKELTFRGSIKLGDLLTIITNKEYVNNVLGINVRENTSVKK